ncbi:MAG: sigma-70 family RNA polymerase sigma factor [Gammaproteobacteria bacterium]|nr:sigma-70 family RNA polymerase sigma factor [Gammaproteobacteria bacterium]
MEIDDRTLIDRVLDNGDEHAFTQLVKRYQSQLRYSLRQITGWDEALADDLAQETFIKVYKSLHQYQGNAKFFTWMYRIAYNCFAAHCRSRKPEVQLEQAEITEQGFSPETGADLHRDFARALKMFLPEQRMALHLSYQRQLSHSEIAEIMDCPLGTVKSYISRGNEKLKQEMMSWHPGE